MRNLLDIWKSWWYVITNGSRLLTLGVPLLSRALLLIGAGVTRGIPEVLVFCIGGLVKRSIDSIPL